jgi:alkylation response protein AidB-like acyl-CoA dehydrogenase
MNQALNYQGVDDSAPSELQSMIASSVERLFTEQITPEVLARFDAGHAATDLWQHVVDNGLPGAMVAENAGGSGANWLEISPVLRAIGYWKAPLALSETMLAAWLLSSANLEVPDGPITLIQSGRQGDLNAGGRWWPTMKTAWRSSTCDKTGSAWRLAVILPVKSVTLCILPRRPSTQWGICNWQMWLSRSGCSVR